MGGYAIAEALVWGDQNSQIHKEEFDMIVLADCVYYEEVSILKIQMCGTFASTLMFIKEDKKQKFWTKLIEFTCISLPCLRF